LKDLAACAEAVAAAPGRNEKIARVAAYLATLGDEDLARAVLYLSGRPFPASDPRKLSVGHATLREALVQVTGWDLEMIATCYREVGDTGETVALLVRRHTEGRPMTLAQTEGLYTELQRARRTERKVELLAGAFRTFDWMALKYFVKGITGNLRIGLQEKMVEEALAAATGLTGEVVRGANNRSGDLARVALAARGGTIGEIEAVLFHPLDFMLAKPLDAVEDLADPGEWWVEDKYDGIRAQAHIDAGRVRLFTRGLEETTAAFPEVILELAPLAGPLVLDGEILAWREGRALAFSVLQQRIARKQVSAKTMAEVPVIFLAYDLLLWEGELQFGVAVEERRRRLERLGLRHLAPQARLASHEEVEERFGAARGRGNEGLILKRAGSLYESGKRGGNWLKVKRPYGTLDVVVTAAEQGHGRRASVLSDVTFAVRSGDRFLNVGKAYSGLTDEEIRQLTVLFKAATVERYGRVSLLRPEVVLEVAFDGVQKSPRHKSGYALRFPRIVRWRQDKGPAECDTLERVQELYEASLR
jgi:DNA ligase-1